MNRRIIAMLLALVLAFSMLTGCSSASAPAADAKTDASEDAAAADDAAEGETADDDSTGEVPAEDDGTSTVDLPTLEEIPEEAKADVVSYVTDGALKIGDVVATANGQDITAEQYLYWLAYEYAYTSYMYSMYGMSMDPFAAAGDDGTTVAQSLGAQALNIAEMNAVIAAKAEEAGAGELTAQQQTDRSDLATNYTDNSVLYYATTMAAIEKAYDDACRMNNLQDKLFEEGGELEPTEQTLQDYADEQGIFNCRYILQQTNELAEDDTEGRDAKKQKAQELFDELSKSDPEKLEEDFAALQAENNDDGNTEPFTFDASSSLVSGFREKLAEMKVGELGLSDETDYGYFVLLRLAPDMDSVKETYTSDAFNGKVTEWMDSADLQTTDALNNLDMNALFERLIPLQNVIMVQEQETAEAEAAADGDAAAEAPADAQEGTAEEPAG